MEKIIRNLIIVLLCIVYLHADFDAEFASIQKTMQHSPSEGYTDLQSLYLHLILHGDESQRKKVLKSLIEGAQSLGYNYDRYEKALYEIDPDALKSLSQDSVASQAPQKDTKVETQAQIQSLDVAKLHNVAVQNNRLKLRFSEQTPVFRSFALQSGEQIRYVFDFHAVLPDVSKTLHYGDLTIRASQFDRNIVRVVITSDSEIYIQNEKKDNFIFLTLPPKDGAMVASKDAQVTKIVDTDVRDGSLRIEFDNPTAFEHFVLRGDKIRYVYDFKSVFPDVTKTFHVDNSRIRVSQYDSETTRVVVSADSQKDLSPIVTDNSFTLNFVQSGQAPTLSQQSRRDLRVVIDPGHGGKDPGAIGHRGFREKVVAFNFSVAIKEYLEQSGIEVLLTREDDTFISLSDRTAFANRKKADVFVSIHANAAESSSLRGIETYFLSPARSERAKRVAATENKEVMDKMAELSSQNTFLSLLNRERIIESNKLAIDVQQNMLFNVSQVYSDVRDGGVREAPFWVLVGAQMPAVLVEIGYLTNATEAERLVLRKHREYQDAIARGIAEGIINYLSLARR